MLTLTEFGKFREAGVAISFGLFIALLCALDADARDDVPVRTLDLLARYPT